jgi:hypothetical protein
VALTKALAPLPDVRAWILEREMTYKLNDDKSADRSSASELKHSQKELVSTAIRLLRAAIEAGNSKVQTNLVDHVVTNTRLYPALELAAWLRKSGSLTDTGGKALNELVANVKVGLASQANFKRKPSDWSIMVTSTCESGKCVACKTLERFLGDAVQQIKKWPLAKDGRRHIHQIIEGMEIPVSHTTTRTGSPFTLVLTKSASLFKLDQDRAEAADKELRLFQNL